MLPRHILDVVDELVPAAGQLALLGEGGEAGEDEDRHAPARGIVHGAAERLRAAVDEHVGRFQIFGTKENLAHAVAEVESLREKIQELELQLRRCAREAAGARAQVNGPVQSSSELSPAGIP